MRRGPTAAMEPRGTFFCGMVTQQSNQCRLSRSSYASIPPLCLTSRVPSRLTPNLNRARSSGPDRIARHRRRQFFYQRQAFAYCFVPDDDALAAAVVSVVRTRDVVSIDDTFCVRK